MPEPLDLFLSIIFSALGVAYLHYGRKVSGYFIVAGIALIGYTFFVTTTIEIIVYGIILSIMPFLLEKFL